jgi:hypothetical protein
MLLIEHVLVRLFQVFQFEHFLVDNRMDIILLNSSIHILELESRSNEQTSHGADIVLSRSQHSHEIQGLEP